jgi:hypothetical protein
MGYYSKFSPEGEAEFSNELVALTDYLTKNKNSKFVVNITAGESQVTNKDNEHGGVTLPEGDLAKKRAESVKLRLIKFFGDLETKGVNTPTFSEPIIRIGQTKYPKTGSQQEKDKAKVDNADAYKKEQFVTVSIVIVNNTTPKPSIPNFITHRKPNAYQYQKYYYGVDQWIKERSEISGFTVSNSNMLLTRNTIFGTNTEIKLKNSQVIEPFDIKIYQILNQKTFDNAITVPHTEKLGYKPTEKPGRDIKQTIRYADTYHLRNDSGGKLTPFQWSFAKFYITNDDAKYGTDSWSQISNKPEQINDITSYQYLI